MTHSKLPLARALALVLPLVLPLVATPVLTPALAHDAEWAEAVGAGAMAKPVPSITLRTEDSLPLDPRFSPDRVRADVAFFADDLLGGRDTGSPGHELAARDVAARFAGLGLTTAGEANSWYQRVTLQKTTRLANAPSEVAITAPDGTITHYAHGKDAVVGISARSLQLDVAAPLVFVGYGIENKLLGMDDYAGLDVRGKIVVMLAGFPAGLPSEEAAHASATKPEAAAAHGAIGIITLATHASAKVRPWERQLQYAQTPRIHWVEPDGQVHENAPAIRASAMLSDAAAASLFAKAPRKLAQILDEADRKLARPKGFDLKLTARITGQSQAERITSPNVLGMIAGSDPALKDQFVVLSGHIDHLGTDAPKPGEAADKDRIYNGALDNAAGTATLLEVARVMAEEAKADPAKAPRRSVIFLVSTGEEKGLIGADYFARHQGLASGKIVGNVDLDMPLLLYPFTDVIAFGADHSSLGAMVGDAVKAMGVATAPDPMPAETIFVRSDHYMFVKQGIPAVFLATGYANGGDGHWGDFLKNRYHKPSDDMAQAINWRAGARFAEANWRITTAMANSATPPLWYAGDFFGQTFAPDAPKAPRPPK